MTSLLAPAYELTLGEQLFVEQAVELVVELAAAPALDLLVARLPAAVSPSAGIGDPAVLTLDGGEGSETVFTGQIVALRRGVDELVVTACDAGGALAALRPTVTYERVTAGSAISQLCDEAGVDTGDVDDGPTLPFYAADPGRTAIAHVARLASFGGALARVTGDGELEASVLSSEPSVALRFGREVTAFSERQGQPTADAWTVAGESGAGDASAPEAMRPTSDFFAGNRPEGPGKGRPWRFEPSLRTAAAAATAGAALDLRVQAAAQRATLQTFLVPGLRPGTVLEVQDLPEAMVGGPLWADHVVHRLTCDGASTRARLWRAGESSSLLGSAMAAVGALL